MYSYPYCRTLTLESGYNGGMTRLSELALPSLGHLPSELELVLPRYDRRAVMPGIVHIGVGGFHRAHEAVYLDDLMAQGGAQEWGICGVGLRPADKAMRDALVPQDCLYTIVVEDAYGAEARIIGSLVKYLFAPEETEAVLDALAAPQTRIVSLTITEGGYNFSQATGEFDADHADIQHDLVNPAHPVSVFGYLAEALDRRRLAGHAPFTVLSCDNVPQNGDIARKTLLAFAALRDPGLHDWIAAHVAFPNSMVDRITPQTTESDRVLVQDDYGYEDAWPVVCEPFRQWIIEDKFSDGRPPLERVGAQFTSDVHPYEMMKLRLLNAGHSAIGYLGFLAGYPYIHEIMADDLFRAYLRRLMNEEVTPLLRPVPGIDLTEYKATLLTRFANPTLKDQTSRICLDGSSKVPKFLLPSLHEALAAGSPATLLTLALAGWFRYLRGEDEQGRPFAVDDPRAADLQKLAQQGKTDPRPLLGVTDLFSDLGQSPAFVARLTRFGEHLERDGARKTLGTLLTEGGKPPQ